MATATSGVSPVGNKFYTTTVTKNNNGSLTSVTSRTDAQGKNAVPVKTVNAPAGGGSPDVKYEIGATPEEQTAFKNPNSPEGRAFTQHVTDPKVKKDLGISTPEEEKLINSNAGKPNTATNSPAPDAQGGTLPTSEQSAAVAAEASSFKEGTRKKYESLKYPENLSLETQDVIKFTILQYKPSLAGGQTEQTGRIVDLNGIVKGTTVLGSITLPIPAGINDGNVVGWSMDVMNDIQEMAGNLAGAVLDGDMKKAGEVVDGASKTATSNDARSLIKGYFTNMATQSSGLAKRSQGATPNNNQELLFGSPGLRNFSFQFSFYPRGPKEAIIVRKIIRTFKQSMSVKRSETSLLLKSPHTFAIQYMTSKDGKAVAHPYLNRFKECALTSCSVDYTPDGTYMTYSSRGNPDGDEKSMTAYRMTLSFSELEPLFDDEYGESDYDNVGF
jgi:hypothetical protein